LNPSQLIAEGLDPLEYFLDVLNSAPPAGANAKEIIQWESIRCFAAKQALPYLHPKLTALEVTGPEGGPVQTEEVPAVSTLELARRVAVLMALASRGGDDTVSH
jgi:hypothetical protein